MSTDHIALATEALTAEGPDAYHGANVAQLATFLGTTPCCGPATRTAGRLSRSSTPPCAHGWRCDAAEPD
jgi:hypothetical protein